MTLQSSVSVATEDNNMVEHTLFIAVITMAFVVDFASPRSMYHPNHKYDVESDLTVDQKEPNIIQHRYRRFHARLKSSSPDHASSQLLSPLSDEEFGDENTLKRKEADRKAAAFYDNQYPSKSSKGKRSHENFVTPKGEALRSYEVTTKKLVDIEPEHPSALGLNNDVAIALDDEDIEQEEPELSKPEHLNPLVYYDSYGRLHGEGRRPGGHPRSPPRLLGSYGSRSRATGRVRMQVFRGPTSKVGHRRWAPWGYFVVQPADGYHHAPHRYPGPPYNYR